MASEFDVVRDMIGSAYLAKAEAALNRAIHGDSGDMSGRQVMLRVLVEAAQRECNDQAAATLRWNREESERQLEAYRRGAERRYEELRVDIERLLAVRKLIRSDRKTVSMAALREALGGE